MADQQRQHNLTIAIGGKQLGGWIDYSVDVNILSPANAFSMSRQLDADAFQLCETDAPVTVHIDQVPVMSGLIDVVGWSARGGLLKVSGRCKSGRLVQESAPAVEYAGLKMSELVRRLASPWYTSVALEGARDRAVRRGKGHKAPAPSEPVVVDAVTGRRIEPGAMRWQVIEDLVSQAGYLAWGAADGKTLIIAPPNRDQGVQYLFTPTTCIDLDGEVSIGDGYSQLRVLGSSRATDSDYGPGASDRHGTALDFPGPEGIGGDFQFPKRLDVVDASVRSIAEASRRAQSEMKRRNQRRRTVVAECRGHGQALAGGAPTLFTPNTIARVQHPLVGFDALYLVTGCTYSASRASESTRMQLVPRNTELTL